MFSGKITNYRGNKAIMLSKPMSWWVKYIRIPMVWKFITKVGHCSTKICEVEHLNEIFREESIITQK